MSTTLESRSPLDSSPPPSDWVPYMKLARETLAYWENQGLDYRAFDETAESREALVGRIARTLLVIAPDNNAPGQHGVQEKRMATREDAEKILSLMLSSHGRAPLLPPEPSA